MTNLTLEEKQELIRMALAAREKAYAPYSNFMVGAALRAREGGRDDIALVALGLCDVVYSGKCGGVEGGVVPYKDEDPAIEYAGSLIVMTNRLSASASEIFAGAIKDYKRGILVGDKKTHGKGTVQTVADLTSYLHYIGYDFPAGSIKLTNAKFYRINGASTQLKGVTPDIAFPTFTDTMETGEEKLDNPMPWDEISPVAHAQYDPNICAVASELRRKSDARVAASPEFAMLKRDIAYLMKNKDKKTISLNLEQRWKEYLREKDIYDEQAKLLHLDSSEKDKKKNTKKDLYLDETLNIMRDYITRKRGPRQGSQPDARHPHHTGSN